MKIITSIITVVLNDPEGLLETAESVVQQTSNNYEWIVIDGGSSDSTLAAVRRFESVNVVIHSGMDEGIYDAMNKGIDLSTGQFLIFMNAGDTFSDATVLADVECSMQGNKDVDVILGGTYQKIMRCEFYRPPKNISWIVSGLPAFHQSTMYRADLMRDRKYDLKYALLADYEWLTYQCVAGITVGYLNRPLSNFTVGGASYRNIRLKFKDSYAVKYMVLGESKFQSFFSSLYAIGKTYFVMNVLYKVCGIINFCGHRQQIKHGSMTLTTEYYKHPKSQAE